MLSTKFTDFRKNAARLFDKVESGETVVVTRYGRPVAEIIPYGRTPESRSWKREPLRLAIRGLSISREIVADRKTNRS